MKETKNTLPLKGMDRHWLNNEKLIHDWIQDLNGAAKTSETYRKALRRFSLWLELNERDLVCRQSIQDFRDEMQILHRPATVRLYLCAIRSFLGYLEQEMDLPDPSRGIKSPKMEKSQKRDYLDKEQAVILLDAVNRADLMGKRDYAMLMLMLETGLRTISLEQANLEDLDFHGSSPILWYQSKGKQTKNDYVKLPDRLYAAIQDYLMERSAIHPLKGKDPLFISLANRTKGSRLTTRSIRRICKAYLRQIGIESERISAHSLRHTAATLNLLADGSLEETRQLLGHASIETTLIYAHAIERDKNTSEQRIEDYLFSNKKTPFSGGTKYETDLLSR